MGGEVGDEVKEEEWMEDSVGRELKNSRSEEEEETSRSTSPSSSKREGEAEVGLEGSDDKSVVDKSEDPPTSTEREKPPPTSAYDGPCSVCSCSTLDNNRKFSDMLENSDETLVQIDCSHLNLSTWAPLQQQAASLAVDFSHNLLATLPTFAQVRRGKMT